MPHPGEEDDYSEHVYITLRMRHGPCKEGKGVDDRACEDVMGCDGDGHQ